MLAATNKPSNQWVGSYLTLQHMSQPKGRWNSIADEEKGHRQCQ